MWSFESTIFGWYPSLRDLLSVTGVLNRRFWTDVYLCFISGVWYWHPVFTYIPALSVLCILWVSVPDSIHHFYFGKRTEYYTRTITNHSRLWLKPVHSLTSTSQVSNSAYLRHGDTIARTITCQRWPHQIPQQIPTFDIYLLNIAMYLRQYYCSCSYPPNCRLRRYTWWRVVYFRFLCLQLSP